MPWFTSLKKEGMFSSTKPRERGKERVRGIERERERAAEEESERGIKGEGEREG